MPSGDTLTAVNTDSSSHPALAAVGPTVALIAEPAVGQCWSEASVLAGYRVGGLAVHLARAIETIPTYLLADPPEPDATYVDAAGYYATVLGEHDPLDSDFHRAVRERAEERVDGGQLSLVAQVSVAATWLTEHPRDLQQPIRVLDGTAMHLGDYLDTRLTEMLIHSHDLAVSVGLPPPSYSHQAWTVVARVLAETAAARHAPKDLALALARPERSTIGAFTTPAPHSPS